MKSLNLSEQKELFLLLNSALEKDQVSHALLLSGPKGIGKRSWGQLLAQALLCPQREGANPCGNCFSCRSFGSGNHSNFLNIEPVKRKIKIEQIRALRDHFYLQNGNKVCLIDQAELMTAVAASSLLKILEEPPEGLYFILLAEQPRFIFDTILSRCQSYRLHPLTVKAVQEILVKELHLEADRAAMLARISAGLPGRALELAGDEQFEARLAEAKTLAFNLASGCDSDRQLLYWANALAERSDLDQLLGLMALIYRDGLVQNLSRRGEAAAIRGEQNNWLETVRPQVLEEALLLVNEAATAITATNVNKRLLMEKTLISLQRRLLSCQMS